MPTAVAHSLPPVAALVAWTYPTSPEASPPITICIHYDEYFTLFSVHILTLISLLNHTSTFGLYLVMLIKASCNKGPNTDGGTVGSYSGVLSINRYQKGHIENDKSKTTYRIRKILFIPYLCHVIHPNQSVNRHTCRWENSPHMHQ
jgi:hypothetical protein